MKTFNKKKKIQRKLKNKNIGRIIVKHTVENYAKVDSAKVDLSKVK